MRVLYFDIDGTLLTFRRGEPKARLARGAFEAAVRDRSFDRLVCVGSVVDVLAETRRDDAGWDDLRTVYLVCEGTFADEAWFRSKVSLIGDSRFRAREVSLEHDWWFMDDQAESFFRAVGLEELFERERNRRIFVPDPEGDGSGTLRWLGRIPATG